MTVINWDQPAPHRMVLGHGEPLPGGTDTDVPPETSRHLKFSQSHGFHRELKRRVDAYFKQTGYSQRDCPRMYLKTAVIFAWCAASYLLLVFAADAWWQVVPLAISLGLAVAGIGFSVQHDARHQAYSDRPWVNKLMALSLDAIGGSSYLWGWKHNVIHHTYVNITGHDSDIELRPLGRLSPHQPRRWFHRFQHFYLWPLYGFVTVKWQLADDFRDAIVARIGTYQIPRPRGLDLFVFLAGKAFMFFLAFGLPALFHPIGTVFLVYLLASWVSGVVLSVVFQLAHCVGEAAFPMPSAGSARMETDWAIHQVQTTVDFAPRSWLTSWYVGGLNFQIEHHLFPRICHIHYPALAPIVEETCRDFGIHYAVQPTVAAGIASHYRWLRLMGRTDPEPAPPAAMDLVEPPAQEAATPPTVEPIGPPA